MEEKKQEVQAAPKPQIMYNYKGRVFSDEDTVKYLQHENFIHKLENKLLGDFDQNGNYGLPNEILKTFVGLKKTFINKEGQIIKLKATCGTIVFNFRVEIGVFSKGQSFAQLKFIETAYDIIGDEKIEVVTPVVFYTDDTDAFFETKIKKIFNIADGDDDEGRQKENEVIALALLEKLKLMGKLYERYLLESRLRDKIYVEKVLKILAQDPTFGSIALKKYELMLKKYEKVLNPANKNYYRVLKQILDQVIMEEEKSMSKEVALLINRLRKVYVQANQQTIDALKAPPAKKEEKKAEKLKTPSGPGLISFKDGKSADKKADGKNINHSMYTSGKDKSAEQVAEKSSSNSLLGDTDFTISAMKLYKHRLNEMKEYTDQFTK